MLLFFGTCHTCKTEAGGKPGSARPDTLLLLSCAGLNGPNTVGARSNLGRIRRRPPETKTRSTITQTQIAKAPGGPGGAEISSQTAKPQKINPVLPHDERTAAYSQRLSPPPLPVLSAHLLSTQCSKSRLYAGWSAVARRFPGANTWRPKERGTTGMWIQTSQFHNPTGGSARYHLSNKVPSSPIPVHRHEQATQTFASIQRVLRNSLSWWVGRRSSHSHRKDTTRVIPPTSGTRVVFSFYILKSHVHFRAGRRLLLVISSPTLSLSCGNPNASDSAPPETKAKHEKKKKTPHLSGWSDVELLAGDDPPVAARLESHLSSGIDSATRRPSPRRWNQKRIYIYSMKTGDTMCSSLKQHKTRKSRRATPCQCTWTREPVHKKRGTLLHPALLASKRCGPAQWAESSCMPAVVLTRNGMTQ